MPQPVRAVTSPSAARTGPAHARPLGAGQQDLRLSLRGRWTAENDGMEIDRSGFEVLDRSECFRLLNGAGVGRIAVTSGSLPLVLPLSYVMDGDTVVVETGRGNPLESATAGAVVAFEVDNLNEHGYCGGAGMGTGVGRGGPD